MKQNIVLEFKNGEKIPLTLDSDKKNYTDPKGTKYPSLLFDPNYCGVYPLVTGKWDPHRAKSCKPHDAAFIRRKLGRLAEGESNATTQGRFIKDIGSGMVDGVKDVALGLYAVFSGVPYIILGAGVGGAKWLLEDLIENK